MARKLYRSRTDKMIAGVCGGLAEVLDLDPTVVRIVFVLLALLGGHGILLYMILWIIMPREDQIKTA
jgi:phage shock protein C